MSKMLIWMLVGGGVGAAIGYFGQCTSGACALASNWKRGAIAGAVLGLILFYGSGGPVSPQVNESTANVKRIQETEFEAEVLKSAQPVVVDFYADWCGPCRTLAPRLDKVAGQFSGQVKVVKVNVDHAPRLAQQYGIQGIPAVKFFQGGKVVGGFVGLVAERDLQSRIAKLAETQRGTPTNNAGFL